MAPLVPATLDATLSAPLTEAVTPATFSVRTTVEPTVESREDASYQAASWRCMGGTHVQASPFSAALTAAAHASGSGHVKAFVSLADDESVKTGMAAREHIDGGTKPLNAFMLSTLRADKHSQSSSGASEWSSSKERTAPAGRSTMPGCSVSSL